MGSGARDDGADADAADALVDAVRSALAGAGDPERAADQQRYMKSALPYRGLRAPELRALLRPVLDRHLPDQRAAWERAIRALVDDATHREEWYAALALARHRRARRWRDAAALPLWEHVARATAWWDVVDELASHLVGDTLAADRAAVTPVILTWSQDDDLWVRRVAILSQLRHGADTDVDLLERVLEVNLLDSPDGTDFFIRKAIGWALRQYARTDADRVLAFLDAHADRVSPLSRREATKHLTT